MNNLIKIDKVFKYYYNDGEVQYIDVPYNTVVEKINSVDFREHVIVDIRNKKTNLIFDDFHKFQRDFLADKFFNKRNNNPTDGFSMTLYFLEDKKNNNISNSNKNKILDNYDFALKQFITEEELPNILSKKDKNIILPEITRVVPFRERKIEFKNFNLIFGANASGKTMLLRKFSEYTSFPIISLSNISQNCNLSDTTVHLNKLYSVISKYSELEMPLMLDNIRWNAIDSRNKLKLIDTLCEHLDKEQIIITACQEDVKRLIKSRVYNPNIIEL